MRFLLSFFFIVSFTYSSFSQNSSEPNKKLFYGFNIGLNYTNIQARSNPIDVMVKNNAGFSMGILSGFQFSDGISVISNTAISFHENTLDPFANSSNLNGYSVLSKTIDFGLQAKFNIAKKNSKSPYITFGPALQIPISKPTLSTDFQDKTSLALEIGIGCDAKFTEFTFAPEIRYAYGLNNINTNPIIEEVNFHTVKLIFNFKG